MSEWYAVYTDSVVHGDTDDCGLRVTGDRLAVQFRWQEFETGDKHAVRPRYMKSLSQTECHEYINAARKHRADCHEFTVIRNGQRRQRFLVRGRFGYGTGMDVPQLQETGILSRDGVGKHKQIDL